MVKSRRNSTQLTEIDTIVRALLQERVALCMEHVDGSLGVVIHHWLLLMVGHSVSANDLDTSSQADHVTYLEDIFVAIALKPYHILLSALPLSVLGSRKSQFRIFDMQHASFVRHSALMSTCKSKSCFT